jgi:uncharacterized membrane protein YbhN (UPF0104 family)
VTPANLGADFYRAFLLRSAATNWNGIVAPIVGQRLVSTLALLGLAGAVGLLRALATMPPSTVLPSIALLAAAAAVMGGARTARLSPVRSLIGGRLPERLRAVLAADLALFRLPLLLTVTFHAGSVLLAYVLVIAVHSDAPFFTTASLLLVARLTILLPLTPYGLGFQEASLAVVLPTVGLSGEEALAVAVLSRLGTVLTALVGASILVLSRRVVSKDLAVGVLEQESATSG